jgi:hypothetical protein
MFILAANETRRQLRYVFTDAERLEKGKQLADTLNKLSSTEADLDRIKSDFKARTSVLDTEISTLKDCVFSGFELREYICFWEYDAPEKGKKTLRRKEPPHDIACIEEMTEADRQTVIESIEAQLGAKDRPTGSDGGGGDPGTQIVPVVPASTPRTVNIVEFPTPAPKPKTKKRSAADIALEKVKESAAKKHRSAANGVVATEADGPDFADSDANKAAE